MKDIDIIDRKHTTVSPVQAILALLALLPIIAIALHLNPAFSLWGQRLYHKAMVTAIIYPGMYALLLGMAFPVVSAIRGEMSRRALLVTLVIFGIAALCLLPEYQLPWFLETPHNPGHTKWINYLQGISFHATFAGYTTGFTIGAVLALFFESSVSSTSKDGESQCQAQRFHYSCITFTGLTMTISARMAILRCSSTA